MTNRRSQGPLKFKLPKMLPMPEAERDLYLRVVDGAAYLKDLGPLLHHINNYRDAQKMLKWLIANRCVGNTLLQLWRKKFNGSMLETARWIISEGNRDWKDQKILAGEHFNV